MNVVRHMAPELVVLLLLICMSVVILLTYFMSR